MYLYLASVSLAFSSIALLVMSIERYLGGYYPVFHRTSVTKRRLLILFPKLLSPEALMYTIYSRGLVTNGVVLLLVFMALYTPPFVFFTNLCWIIKTNDRVLNGSAEHDKE